MCIYIMNERPSKVIKRFKERDPGEIGLSTITVSELHYGVSKSVHREENRQRLEDFMVPFDILDYDGTAARAYGDIRFQLEKQGQPIGPLDMLIAAQAFSHNLILITNNDREFKRIKGLQIDNWTK